MPHVNLQVYRGEVFGFLGSNGFAKTAFGKPVDHRYTACVKSVRWSAHPPSPT